MPILQSDWFVNRDLSDKLEVISPFVPSTHQLYKWLFEAVDLLLSNTLLFWGKMIRIWYGMQSVQCRSLSVERKDFLDLLQDA